MQEAVTKKIKEISDRFNLSSLREQAEAGFNYIVFSELYNQTRYLDWADAVDPEMENSQLVLIRPKAAILGDECEAILFKTAELAEDFLSASGHPDKDAGLLQLMRSDMTKEAEVTLRQEPPFMALYRKRHPNSAM